MCAWAGTGAADSATAAANPLASAKPRPTLPIVV
jgi:hypothetical protein